MITKNIDEAREILINDDLIAIPTETVYGLAANAFSEEAVSKIYALKKRPSHNPLIVHIKSSAYLKDIAINVPEIAVRLAEVFWPGPLTLVLKKSSRVPDIVTAGKDTVAVRVPNHPMAIELLEGLDFPIAAPSANPFGCISPTCALHVYDYFGKDIKVILDGGECQHGIESTIIGFEGDQPVLYRLGSTSVEEIEHVIGNPLLRKTKDDTAPAAPGMLSRHYAPDTLTVLTEDIVSQIAIHRGKRIGLLLFRERVEDASISHQEILSTKGDTHEAAKNLYAAMHRLDKLGLDIIIAERLPDADLGASVNDRLQRAVEK